ncbi:5,6-dimethylbenzimidazole synthase [Rhodoligotrophos sp. lm1]|uniref:5,6-dimethylbenzimidazole synthase n=1 Tax=Rhodoligotrophos defluvii TaxID=2561934 RepID=UPI0010C9960C
MIMSGVGGHARAGKSSLAPAFDDAFRVELEALLRWRRDVRHFRRDPVDGALLDHLLSLVDLAPSVGNSQPWRIVRVESAAARQAVRASFEAANAAALNGYEGEQAALYARLKLAGLDDAPVQLAVFVEEGCAQGHGLGRQTMPEMLRYSAVSAIHTLWIAARAYGLGLGWVSILDPDAVTRLLAFAPSWRLVGYLCLGHPRFDQEVPELERAGWQARTDGSARIFVK